MQSGKSSQLELVEDTNDPGDWRVEEIGSDGEVYVAIFLGFASKPRAEEYFQWKLG